MGFYARSYCITGTDSRLYLIDMSNPSASSSASAPSSPPSPEAILKTTFTRQWKRAGAGSVIGKSAIRELIQNAIDYMIDKNLNVVTVPGVTPQERLRLVERDTGAVVVSLFHTDEGIRLVQRATEWKLAFFMHGSNKGDDHCGGKGEGMKCALFDLITAGCKVEFDTLTKSFIVTFTPSALPDEAGASHKAIEVMTFTQYAQADPDAADELVINITAPPDTVPTLHALYEDYLFLPYTADSNPATDDRIWLPEPGTPVRVFCKGIFVKEAEPMANEGVFSCNFATRGGADVLNSERTSFRKRQFEATETQRLLTMKVGADAVFRRAVYLRLRTLRYIPSLFSTMRLRELFLEEMLLVHAADLVGMPEGATPWPMARDSDKEHVYPMLGKHAVPMGADMADYLTHHWTPQTELEALLKRATPVVPGPEKAEAMKVVDAMVQFACGSIRHHPVVFLNWSDSLRAPLDNGLYDYTTGTVYLDSRTLDIESRSIFLTCVIGTVAERLGMAVKDLSECHAHISDPTHVMTKVVRRSLADLLKTDAATAAAKEKKEQAQKRVAAAAALKRKAPAAATKAGGGTKKQQLRRPTVKPVPRGCNLSVIRPLSREPLAFRSPAAVAAAGGRGGGSGSILCASVAKLAGGMTTAENHAADDMGCCHKVPPMTLMEGIYVEDGNPTFTKTPAMAAAAATLKWFTDEVFLSTPEMPMPPILPAAFAGALRGFCSSHHQIYINLTYAVGKDQATFELLAHELAHASCATLALPSPHNATFASHMTRMALHFAPAYHRALAAEQPPPPAVVVKQEKAPPRCLGVIDLTGAD